MKDYAIRNRYTFGLGTIGRDMVYAIVSMYMSFYLTDVLDLSKDVLWWVGGIILFARIYDALNDPIMGFIVDNTKTRWGKFKPWIAIGATLSSIFTVLLFTDFGLKGAAFIGVFAALYLMWGMSYTANDISFWSMMPSLSVDQKEREKIGSIARICANIGLFFVVAGIVPLTKILGDKFGGGLPQGYFFFAIIVSSIMVIGQCVTLFGVKESGVIVDKRQSTSLRELLNIIVKNDQLLFTAIAMSLFMIGYMTTTSFGLYFFKYAYGNEGMYSIFALILGLSQVTALAVFPLFSKRFDRKTLYTTAIILVIAGYVLFFFAPLKTIIVGIDANDYIQQLDPTSFIAMASKFIRISPMICIGAAGILIFVGQSFIQLLMLMFLADTVDYGHWKLGKRNDSITFSLQPFINKMGGAIASGVTMAIIIVSGIKDAKDATEVSANGLLMMKLAMLIFPLICIAVSYVIYLKKYKIDSKFYGQILSDLRDRGEIKAENG